MNPAPAEPFAGAFHPWGNERAVYLYPGEVHASASPGLVTTILGTCVAVCLWDEEAGVGGINHYLLPFAAPDEGRSCRYGDAAIGELLAKLHALGAERRRLRAKVFGGLCSQATYPRDLGTRNVELALARLAAEGIPLLAQDVGGPRGRKLVYRIPDGAAWVRVL